MYHIALDWPDILLLSTALRERLLSGKPDPAERRAIDHLECRLLLQVMEQQKNASHLDPNY